MDKDTASAAVTFEPIQGAAGCALQTATATIVAALLHSRPGQIDADKLPDLITSVQTALAAEPGVPKAEPVPEEPAKPTASQIKKSIAGEHLVSFIDGKSYKTLKRHLSTHGLDPRSYRKKFGLPEDYPMVAPAYAEKRSQLARQIGLGQPGGMARREQQEPAAA